VVDPAGPAVTLPAGVGLDPGGIGKGYAADLLVAELRAAGAADGLLVDDQGGLHRTTGFGRFTVAGPPGHLLQEVAG